MSGSPVSGVPSVVIGVPVYGQLDLTGRAVRSLDALTPVEIDLLIVDDCGPDRLTEALAAGWVTSGRRWRLVVHETNRGFVGTVNHLFALAGSADVIVVNSDVEVLPGWFTGLRDALGDEVASASSLADHGGLLSVPELASLADPLELLGELPASAEIPVAVAHCTWFTRAAIDAVGGFDEAFSPGYGEEVDWSLRAVRRGLTHRAALRSFVRHAGGVSFGNQSSLFSLQRRHELRLLSRYRSQWFAIRRFARDPATDFAQQLRRIRLGLGG